MKLIGCMAVRNEDWILGYSLRVALKWCDEMVVLLHECKDRSPHIAAEIQSEHPGRVHTMDALGKWDEMNHRQIMLERARRAGATHVAIVDADEVMSANFVEMARENAMTLRPGELLRTSIFNMKGPSEYHSTGMWANRTVCVAFRDDERLGWSGDRFHAREPQGFKLSTVKMPSDGGVIHYWGASEARLVAKHALYKMTEAVRWPQKPKYQIEDLYNLAFVPGGESSPIPPQFTAGYEELIENHLRVDAEPWQIAECKRLLYEHGKGRFSGLSLFGVVE